MTGARCLRRVEIDADTLADGLRRGAIGFPDDAVPAGATLVDRGYDPREGAFYLTFEHFSWTLVPEGEDIPVVAEL